MNKIIRWYGELFVDVYKAKRWGINGSPDTRTKRKAAAMAGLFVDDMAEEDERVAEEQVDGMSQEAPGGYMNSQSQSQATTIYMLELEATKPGLPLNKYVGATMHFDIRMKVHYDGHRTWRPNHWLQLHPPVPVSDFSLIHKEVWYPPSTGSAHECKYPHLREDALVLEMMLEHGFDHVRGGSMCEAKMQSGEKKRIIKMLRHAKGLCLKCGCSHTARVCQGAENYDNVEPKSAASASSASSASSSSSS